MSDVYEIVSGYPKLKKRLDERPEDKEKVRKIINEIHGDFSPAVVKTLVKVVDSTFMKLYDGINLELPKGMDLDKLQKDFHLVLVPNHQSHADYVALTYALYKKYDFPIFVAGGINLNIFPIGPLFRKAGAFFIRRSFSADILYKITFEAYVYYLLKVNRVVEFFFEGGRTRTGKLMKPRYGLFQMLLEAHQVLNDRPLMFVPVSIAHEHIPEEKAHARESSGGKKNPEKTSQLFKIFKLANKKLGTIHVHLGDGIIVKKVTDIKLQTQEVAFECFKAVGRGMPVTPSGLLALVMLDEPTGALTWKQIEDKARDIIDYCTHLKIPMTPSLQNKDFGSTLQGALNILIGNKKVEVLKREKLNQIFYTIKAEARTEVLYHKNMIIHHFLVPGIINATWFNIFNGQIKDGKKLARYVRTRRKELKYEFYLPSVIEMMRHALDIIEYSLGRRVKSLEEGLSFSSQELYQVAAKVRHFSTAFSFIYEAYYLSAIAVKYLLNESFTSDRFIQVAKELYVMELAHGRVMKYPESFSVPILKDTLGYLVNMEVLEKTDGGKFQLADLSKLEVLIEKFIRDLNDQVTINLKFNHSGPGIGKSDSLE